MVLRSIGLGLDDVVCVVHGVRDHHAGGIIGLGAVIGQRHALAQLLARGHRELEPLLDGPHPPLVVAERLRRIAVVRRLVDDAVAVHVEPARPAPLAAGHKGAQQVDAEGRALGEVEIRDVEVVVEGEMHGVLAGAVLVDQAVAVVVGIVLVDRTVAVVVDAVDRVLVVQAVAIVVDDVARVRGVVDSRVDRVLVTQAVAVVVHRRRDGDVGEVREGVAVLVVDHEARQAVRQEVAVAGPGRAATAVGLLDLGRHAKNLPASAAGSGSRSRILVGRPVPLLLERGSHVEEARSLVAGVGDHQRSAAGQVPGRGPLRDGDVEGVFAGQRAVRGDALVKVPLGAKLADRSADGRRAATGVEVEARGAQATAAAAAVPVPVPGSSVSRKRYGEIGHESCGDHRTAEDESLPAIHGRTPFRLCGTDGGTPRCSPLICETGGIGGDEKAPPGVVEVSPSCRESEVKNRRSPARLVGHSPRRRRSRPWLPGLSVHECRM